MERLELTVRGERASSVPSALRDVPEDERADYDGDGFAVVVTEQYFLRTNSTLQATTIFDLADDTTCDVTIIAGGGAAGLMQEDVGSEGAAARKIRRQIEDFCRQHGLDVERG